MKNITEYEVLGTVPLTSEPNQQFQVALEGQNCTLGIYQKDESVFVDLWVDDNPIFLGMMALDRVGLKISDYMGFEGQLWFADQNGTTNPDYTGFGTRYILYYGK
jgi:hypothetical protein